MTDTIESGADIIDVRDIIARVEELREERGDLDELREEVEEKQGEYNTALEDPDMTEQEREDIGDELAGARKDLQAALNWAEENPDEAQELAIGEQLLSELCGYGGDEQWNGDWYPVTLIAESHFEDYARQFAEDIGAIPDDAQWPCTCIDWEKAASELQVDYSSVTFDRVDYLYR